MADYYPLIARAISGLDPAAPGEARRALYERARTALIAQLRGVQPPLTESEITRERLALEEAVRKVESEAAQRARTETQRSDNLPRAKPGDALRATASRSRATPLDPQKASRVQDRVQERAARSERPSMDRAAAERNSNFGFDDMLSQRPPRNLRAESAQPSRLDSRADSLADEVRREMSRVQASPAPMRERAPPSPTPPSSRRSEMDRAPQQGVRGFRDVIADADDLGGAAAQANRAARRTYANVPSPSPEFDRVEPNMDRRIDPMAEVSYDYGDDEAFDDGEHYQTRAPARPKSGSKPGKGQRQGRGPAKPVKTRSKLPLRIALILGVILLLGGAGILVGKNALSFVRAMMKSQPVAEAQKTPLSDNGARPKITDRVGQPGSTQIAPVAQKVVLYDEDPSDPQGKRYVGTVVWRIDQLNGAAGQPPDYAVRGDIEIPERKLKMSLSLRRNTDASLPASHTAELTFALPPDFDGGGVLNVPAVFMKSNEQTRGTALAGIAVRVTDGFFLIGLSNLDADRTRNIQMLKERSWLDIPLIYTNQRRAILAIEKGAPGERAFNDAFTAWGQ
jgi:xanthosine utilization system XapX-like protein